MTEQNEIHTWAAVLDAYENALDRYELAASDPDRGPVEPFVPPPGVLPAELRSRAEQLAARTAELTARLTALSEHHRPRVPTIRRQRDRRSPTATTLDLRA